MTALLRPAGVTTILVMVAIATGWARLPAVALVLAYVALCVALGWETRRGWTA